MVVVTTAIAVAIAATTGLRGTAADTTGPSPVSGGRGDGSREARSVGRDHT
jgi:hypothetical protein